MGPLLLLSIQYLDGLEKNGCPRCGKWKPEMRKKRVKSFHRRCRKNWCGIWGQWSLKVMWIHDRQQGNVRAQRRRATPRGARAKALRQLLIGYARRQSNGQITREKCPSSPKVFKIRISKMKSTYENGTLILCWGKRELTLVHSPLPETHGARNVLRFIIFQILEKQYDV